MVEVRSRKSDVVASDVTGLWARLYAAEHRLHRSEAEARLVKAMLGQSLDARSERAAILDRDGIVLVANAAWRKFQLAGPGVSYPPACEPPTLRTVVQRVLRGRARHASLHYSVIERDARRHYRARIARMAYAGSRWFLVTHRDVTEIESVRRAFVTLADQFMSLQDQERQRIARELHDSTSQHLAAATLQLGRLRQLPLFDAAARGIMTEVGASLRQAQDELRTFTYLLHPPELEGRNFRSAVESLVSGFADRAGLSCRCRIDDAVEAAADEIRHSLFRVLQEALTNIYRHARAHHIVVVMTVRRGVLYLHIKDDGHGLRHDGMTFGVGVLGMQARMHLLGGMVEVRNAKRGTLVSVTAPLHPHCDPPPLIQPAEERVTLALHPEDEAAKHAGATLTQDAAGDSVAPRPDAITFESTRPAVVAEPRRPA